MEIETWFKVEFQDCIGDSFDDATDEKTIKELVEQHLQDWCEEHKIERTCMKILNQK